jgi:serine/threonine-protein kinase
LEIAERARQHGGLKVGDRLGRFELLRELGKGAHGAVYEARDVLLNEHVAIKALQPWLSGDVTLRERFKRELVLTRRVIHPGVCRLYDLHEEDGILFISMQLVEGRSLSQVLRAGLPTHDRVISILRGMCGALAAAHAEGVIHRDLKPANVMVGDYDKIIILDFGIATATGVGQLTRPGEAMGSVPYVPPEVWEGGAATALGDQYALGITAFVCLTKELPYTGKTPLEVLDAVRATTATISSRVADVDPALEAIVLRAMAKHPEDRFPGVRELDMALAALANPERVRPPQTAPVAVVLPEVPLQTGPRMVLSPSMEAQLAPSSSMSGAASAAGDPDQTSVGDDDDGGAAADAAHADEAAPANDDDDDDDETFDAPTGADMSPLTVASSAFVLADSGPDATVEGPLPGAGGPAADTVVEADSVETGDPSDSAAAFFDASSGTQLVVRKLVPPTVEDSPPPQGRPPWLLPIAAALSAAAIVLTVTVVRAPGATDVVDAGPAADVAAVAIEKNEPSPTEALPPPPADASPPEPDEPPAPEPSAPSPEPTELTLDDLMAPAPEPPPTPSTSSTPKKRALSTAAVDAVALAALKKGLVRGDVPALDSALVRARRAAKAGDEGGLDKAVAAARAAADGAVIDKAFVSEKLARFNAAFDKKEPTERAALAPMAKEVMKLMSTGAWPEANTRLNEALKATKTTKKGAR